MSQVQQSVSAMPRLIHEAVARQVRLRPTAVALVYRGQRVDYATLDAAANAYAAALQAAGVRPRTIVPVLLPRTPRLVAVLLAVLKCGAAYAVLDRRWPPERINQVADLAQAAVMVAEVETPRSRVGSWIAPDESLSRTAVSRVAPPRVRVEDADAAAVFFTSGSTGAPKGVLSPHRATMRLFSEGGLAGFRPGRVMLQAAPAAWDAFGLELWGPLTTGGACAIADTDHLLPDDLAGIIADACVDTAWLTSSLFNFLVDEDEPGRSCFSGLSQIFTGGERLSPTHVARFLDRHGDVDLINGYGPAESCVFATTHRVGAADCRRPGGIPLGLPVPETAVYVLNGDRVAAPGTVGEICLAGAGLALGYVNAPEATANAFTRIQLDAGLVRLYRTGDRGVLDADGLLHFRGRTDFQVKIAGVRIEPGEIEVTARSLPGVRDAAVIPVPAANGGYDRLVMFYTAADSVAVTPGEVRRALAARLPAHLVPHLVRQRVALPTTTTGKLDRRSLLASL
ncbi:amino acid adenylation domain-containing protein [Micromonospora sp. NPDC000089]|uniref:amino acid adenylation domain-containing protein n=1 Tax=unclassified Micromonospora TaxID=2617518 RepID=UPI0036CF8E29